tara:strand:+ start:251 stop:442 length:192 start_codon:yes stop_codon:yes gene_type:complete
VFIICFSKVTWNLAKDIIIPVCIGSDMLDFISVIGISGVLDGAIQQTKAYVIINGINQLTSPD